MFSIGSFICSKFSSVYTCFFMDSWMTGPSLMVPLFLHHLNRVINMGLPERLTLRLCGSPRHTTESPFHCDSHWHSTATPEWPRGHRATTNRGSTGLRLAWDHTTGPVTRDPGPAPRLRRLTSHSRTTPSTACSPLPCRTPTLPHPLPRSLSWPTPPSLPDFFFPLYWQSQTFKVRVRETFGDLLSKFGFRDSTVNDFRRSISLSILTPSVGSQSMFIYYPKLNVNRCA